ncbi:MAG: Asp-tRNA(Asn)/Glu-tRNA(Gln) amidotransferase subunit GatA [Pirellulaceae bacterium]|jgi:aspartyl-tRNA(Asn)/glutamyl-tRNA(Gln) amidotransferase subunit A|nr:Asp-tRNA(Asn)/Glu-tRNA(Gln) amidotransferase subunit GatA [Pirellulaceae bacterium]
MRLIHLTVAQLRDALAAGHVSARDVTQACLDEIRRVEASIGAYLAVDEAGALAQAAESDGRRAAGRARSPLDGVPIALKDNLCTRGQATTCSSRMLAQFVPPYDATVVQKLRAAGLVLLGKTNLDEFAMGGSTENAALGTTRNPWDLRRVPGGSSGGSAAAVAARTVPGAIGSDTGGSIRQPAAYCGIVGLKPTYGRVSRYGLIAFASSLDQVGPMTRTAEDAALLLELIAGPDPRDATCALRPVPAYSQTLDQDLAGLRLGVVREHFEAGLDDAVRQAVQSALEVFRSLGATIHDVSLPHSRYGIATYYLIASCEASSNLARYDGVHFGYRTDESALLRALAEERGSAAAPDEVDTPLVRLYRQSRSEALGAEVQRRIMLGTYALSAGYYEAYYLQALRVRRLIRSDFDRAFGEVDLLLGPTTPSPAFCAGEKLADPLSMYLEDLYTVTANLAGIAGLALPCGFTRGGLPVGLQLLAPPFEEARLLAAGHRYQQRTDWHTHVPELP